MYDAFLKILNAMMIESKFKSINAKKLPQKLLDDEPSF